MATIVSRRVVPRHQSRIVRQPVLRRPLEAPFFRGLAFALPLALMFWAIAWLALRPAM